MREETAWTKASGRKERELSSRRWWKERKEGNLQGLTQAFNAEVKEEVEAVILHHDGPGHLTGEPEVENGDF